MGIFDEVAGKLAGAGAGADLSALGIDPQHARLAQAALSELSDEKAGGLAGLQQKFQQAGLGDVMASWIGGGANKPVSAEQLESALGAPLLQRLAQKAGLDVPKVAQLLSTLLPTLVDKLTPQGRLPQAGSPLQAALDLVGGKK